MATTAEVAAKARSSARDGRTGLYSKDGTTQFEDIIAILLAGGVRHVG